MQSVNMENVNALNSCHEINLECSVCEYLIAAIKHAYYTNYW